MALCLHTVCMRSHERIQQMPKSKHKRPVGFVSRAIHVDIVDDAGSAQSALLPVFVSVDVLQGILQSHVHVPMHRSSDMCNLLPLQSSAAS